MATCQALGRGGEPAFLHDIPNVFREANIFSVGGLQRAQAFGNFNIHSKLERWWNMIERDSAGEHLGMNKGELAQELTEEYLTSHITRAIAYISLACDGSNV